MSSTAHAKIARTAKSWTRVSTRPSWLMHASHSRWALPMMLIDPSQSALPVWRAPNPVHACMSPSETSVAQGVCKRMSKQALPGPRPCETACVHYRNPDFTRALPPAAQQTHLSARQNTHRQAEPADTAPACAPCPADRHDHRSSGYPGALGRQPGIQAGQHSTAQRLAVRQSVLHSAE